MSINNIVSLLGDKADYLLNHESKTISKSAIHVPGGDFVDRIWVNSDRNPQVLRNIQAMYNTGRLAGTGYLSILPVDQGIEHSAGASFAKNPTLKILLNWLLKAVVMQWLQPSGD